MPFLADRNYSSSVDDFLEQLKKEQPALQATQTQQFTEFLSHRVDRSLQSDFARGSMVQPAYAYQTQTNPKSTSAEDQEAK